MKHEDYKEMLSLLLYDELSEEKIEVLHKHLLECEECNAEYESLQKMKEVINNKFFLQPSDELLNQSRNELRGLLRAEQSKNTFFSKLIDLINSYIILYYKPAISGTVILILGFFGGFYFEKTLNPEINEINYFLTSSNDEDENQTKIENLRFLETDLETGSIELMFEATRTVKLKGSVYDPNIQKILASSLIWEQNTGIRLKTINTLSEKLNNNLLTDNDVKLALIETVKNDNNPAVRKEALRVLTGLPFDKTIKETLLFVLINDTNSGNRIMAINNIGMLTSQNLLDNEILDVLKKKSKNDNNDYVRLRAANILEEVES